MVAIPYNPFQGLKRGGSDECLGIYDVAIPYNPFQGLKLNSLGNPGRPRLPKVAIPYNPFQGLKLQIILMNL